MVLSDHDYHIHTNLSLCAKKSAVAAEYIKAAVNNGLKAIGFANHYWDESVPGASSFYAPQDTAHVLKLKEHLSDIDIPEGIKVLFGCESEYAHGDLAITAEKAELFDYVLVPHSHTHMKGFVLPEGADTPEKHAAYLVRSFYELATHPLAKSKITGIVHPMHPCGTYGENVTEILKYINDNDFRDCAQAAFENDVAIELNSSTFSQLSEAAYNEYIRFYYACEKAGCTFFAGSDKHDVIYDKDKDSFFKLDRVAAELKLSKKLIL